MLAKREEEKRIEDNSQIMLSHIEQELSSKKMRAQSLLEKDRKFKIVKNQTIRERVEELQKQETKRKEDKIEKLAVNLLKFEN